MKLGLILGTYIGIPFEEALDRAAAVGIEQVEIGCGGYAATEFCDPASLLEDPAKADALLSAVTSRGLGISGLSCHANPLHPRADAARASHESYRATVELAARLDVPTVVLFSGCPGGPDSTEYPNWVTCAWPTEFREILEWQWREKVLPYWREEAAFAQQHGVRLAFEMHPGMVVYNPTTLLRLREACGEAVGANLDPSHLIWQGIDLVAAVEALGREEAIYHFHAKDTELRPSVASVSGVLDTVPLGDTRDRSWVFRTVGFGLGELEWRRVMSALRLAGYDGVLSIEHEDAIHSIDEGIRLAAEFLRRVMLTEPPRRPVGSAELT